MAGTSCVFRGAAYVPSRLSALQPFRSAVPLAAAGIVCLGLIPIFGGPEQPLHWAISGGMVGFGVLLWARRRLRGAEGPLQHVAPEAARQAGRALFIVSAVVGVLVALIVGARLGTGEPIGLLSVALPSLGLAWLATLGAQAWRHRGPAPEPAPTSDRLSRRPVNWDAGASRKSSPSPPPDRHVNA